jgi:hypothetical protein
MADRTPRRRLLRIGGVTDIRSWRALQAELVQPRQLPDGLLEVCREGQPEPDYFIVEIATYADERVEEQVVRDAMLVYLDRRALPEVLTVVLRPRGNLRVTGEATLRSRSEWTQFVARWRVVELWTVPASELLAANDVGLLPWAPLTHFDGPPEPLLQECRDRILGHAPASEQANLLAVTQVMTRLRYNDRSLMALLGGGRTVIESPLIQELWAERLHNIIVRVLTARLGPVPQDLVAALQSVQDDAALEDLVEWAARCPDLEAFRARLAAVPPSPPPA